MPKRAFFKDLVEISNLRQGEEADFAPRYFVRDDAREVILPMMFKDRDLARDEAGKLPSGRVIQFHLVGDSENTRWSGGGGDPTTQRIVIDVSNVGTPEEPEFRSEMSVQLENGTWKKFPESQWLIGMWEPAEESEEEPQEENGDPS